MPGAGSCERPAELFFGVAGQPPRQRPVGHRRNTGLGEYPQRVGFAGRLDDPGQHQILEHLVPTGGPVQAERLIGPAQPVPQVSCPRTDDFQSTAGHFGHSETEVQLALTSGQALPGCGMQRFQLGLVVGRPDMLDVAGAPPRRPHNLHRRRPGTSLHGANVSHHRTLRSPD